MLHGTSSPEATTLAFCGDGVDVDAVGKDIVPGATVVVVEFDVEIEVGSTASLETMDGAAGPSAPQPVATTVTMTVTTTAAAIGQAQRVTAVAVRRSALSPPMGIDETVAKAVLRHRSCGPMALGRCLPGGRWWR